MIVWGLLVFETLRSLHVTVDWIFYANDILYTNISYILDIYALPSNISSRSSYVRCFICVHGLLKIIPIVTATIIKLRINVLNIYKNPFSLLPWFALKFCFGPTFQYHLHRNIAITPDLIKYQHAL